MLLRLLGPLEVERSGVVVPIGSAKQRRLLAELAMADGAAVSIERLIGALWGESPPASARNTLQTYVARLRDSLGDDAIVTRPGGYLLDPDRVEVDAFRFVDAVADAQARATDDPTSAAASLAAVLGAWRGGALAEFDDEAAQAAATRLESLRAEARELRATALLRVGDASGALGEVEHLLAEDPLREPAVLLKARCLGALGRIPEALSTLREHRDRLAEELGLDPSQAVAELEASLLRGEIVPAGVAEPVVLPPDPTSGPTPPPGLRTATLGRTAELKRITLALEASPLVTLVGPGGVGKTRLAIEVTRTAARSAWIDLGPVRRPADVLPALVDGLGVASPRDTDADAVLAALARFDGLLVVDNCEHLVDAVAELLDRLLGRDGPARILATSRERLDVAGELVVPVTPLPVPDPTTATRADPAVQLFRERVAAAGGPEVAPRDAATVAAAVDGLPLAIELAAARAVTVPIPDLLERLSQRLDVLAGTRRRRGDRHRTLTSVIAWSYDLLPERERTLFRRLAVFAATFRLPDAEAVCGNTPLTVAEVAETLAHLAERSMVQVLPDGRYRLLEPLRLFAAEQLEDGGDRDETYRRHRDRVMALAARADEAMTSPDEITVAHEVDQALADLRAVHARAESIHDLATIARLTSRLYRYAYLRVRPDVLQWGKILADHPATGVDPDERARALAASVAGAWMGGDFAEAQRLSQLLVDPPENPWAGITVAEVHGDLNMGLGDLDGSVAAFTHNLELADEVGHEGMAAQAEAGVAMALALRGDAAEARAHIDASIERARASGSLSAQALAHYSLGEVIADTDPDAALLALEEAQRLARAVGARFYEGLARTAEVALRGRHGDPRAALTRYRETLQLWVDTGADSLALTTLRNLVILLARVGADRDAIMLHAVIERTASKPTYGDEERRLAVAVAAARERLASAADVAVGAAADFADLAAATTLALRAIDRALATQASRTR